MNHIERTEEYNEVVRKILNNKDFKKSSRSVHLLKFLYEKAIQGVDVNEFVLGDELFKNNYDHSNSDSKVRVYMHYLRKKLNAYYKEEGKSETLHVAIPKGQYNLSFIVAKTNKEENTGISKLGNVTVLLKYASLLLIGAVLGILIHTYGSKIFKKTYCWETFFDKNANNLCVVGDLTVVSTTHNEKRIFSHHPDFKTESDFVSYIQNHPQPEFSPVDFSFMTKMAPIGVKKLTHWFDANDQDFSIRMEKSFEMDELRDNNIIFMGNFRLMAGLKNIFLSNSKMFTLAQNDSRIMSVKGDARKIHQTKYPDYHWEKNQFGKKGNNVFVEYAMVSYMKLDNNQEALFFSSNHDIGVIATINRFTDPDWIHKFYREHQFSSNAQFNALFKVTGLERSAVRCELVELEIL